MSRGARVLLAIAMLPCALGFAAIGAMSGESAPSGPLISYATAAFCALIALAALSEASRPISLRLIGLVVFATSVWFVGATWTADGAPGDGGARPRPTLRNALAGFCALGLPAAYVMIFGRYPTWGRGSGAFGPDSRE